MNRTMLSQIVWVMFFAHHCLPKVAKNCQKNVTHQRYVGNLILALGNDHEKP